MITLIKGMNCEKLCEASIVHYVLYSVQPIIVQLILANYLEHNIRPNSECSYKRIVNYSEENIKKKETKIFKKILHLCFVTLQIVPWDVTLMRKKILKTNMCSL